MIRIYNNINYMFLNKYILAYTNTILVPPFLFMSIVVVLGDTHVLELFISDREQFVPD